MEDGMVPTEWVRRLRALEEKRANALERNQQNGLSGLVVSGCFKVLRRARYPVRTSRKITNTRSILAYFDIILIGRVVIYESATRMEF
jgi:hypothetical protein